MYASVQAWKQFLRSPSLEKKKKETVDVVSFYDGDGVTTLYYIDKQKLYKHVDSSAPQLVTEVNLSSVPLGSRANLKLLASRCGVHEVGAEHGSVGAASRDLLQNPCGRTSSVTIHSNTDFAVALDCQHSDGGSQARFEHAAIASSTHSASPEHGFLFTESRNDPEMACIVSDTDACGKPANVPDVICLLTDVPTQPLKQKRRARQTKANPRKSSVNTYKQEYHQNNNSKSKMSTCGNDNAWKERKWSKPGNKLRIQSWMALSFDLHERFLALEQLDKHIVGQNEYQKAVMEVINLMDANGSTLNHVNSKSALDGFKENASLRAPALDYLDGRKIADLDRDDIRKGIGYYHFNRVSAGTMRNGPNFNLRSQDDVMFFIDPHVLSQHHFIACIGNVARETGDRCPGKLHSTMTNKEALSEALRAVKKLKEIVLKGAKKVPYNNEIAIFHCVESRFVYPHLAVLDEYACQIWPPNSANADHGFKVMPVTPTSRRSQAGKEASRLTLFKDF